jgi:hypothetical protein
MKKIIVAMVTAVSMVATYASDNQVYDGAGAYLNLNSGIATMQNLPTGAFAMSANAGYNFSRALALEGGYIWLYSSQFGASQTNNIYDVAVKGTIPLSSIFSLYGRLGGALNYQTWGGVAYTGTPQWYATQNSMVNFNALVSLGGSFTLSRHFDLRLEDTVLLPIGGGNATSGQSTIVLAGLQYNF